MTKDCWIMFISLSVLVIMEPAPMSSISDAENIRDLSYTAFRISRPSFAERLALRLLPTRADMPVSSDTSAISSPCLMIYSKFPPPTP